MFRNSDDVKKLGIKHVNILMSDVGMGDLIASLVAINYNITNYRYINFLIWTPDYLLEFVKHLLPDGTVVRNFTDAKKKYNDKLPGISTRWNHIVTPMRQHPVDYGFSVLTDKTITDLTLKNYLQIAPDKIDVSRFNLPPQYVVIGSSSVEKVKEMPSQTINNISDYLNSKGFTPVYVGKSNAASGVAGVKLKAKIIDADYSKGIDLLDKTSALELTKVISDAKAIVCMDGGILHVAGCTQTPIVAGYTFIDPSHNLPIRNNLIGWNCYTVVPENLGCRFCQTNMNFMYGRDMRDCFYDDYACVSQMTSDKFINHLEKIL
jgi:ADP-heptose:LPS heptosyltransferase